MVYIATLMSWAAQLLFFSGLLFQVILNFRRKSVAGLSDLFILALVNGYIIEHIYARTFDLPYSYRIVLPINIVLAVVLVGQRFFYSRELVPNLLMLMLIGMNAGIIFVFRSAARIEPYVIGNIAGWVTTAIWCTYQIPQMAVMYKHRSTRGLSLMLVLCACLGSTVEFISGMWVGLPLQTLVKSFRGIAFQSLIMFQFWYYAK